MSDYLKIFNNLIQETILYGSTTSSSCEYAFFTILVQCFMALPSWYFCGTSIISRSLPCFPALRFTFALWNCFVDLDQYSDVIVCMLVLVLHLFIVLRFLIVVLSVQVICLVCIYIIYVYILCMSIHMLVSHSHMASHMQFVIRSSALFSYFQTLVTAEIPVWCQAGHNFYTIGRWIAL